MTNPCTHSAEAIRDAALEEALQAIDNTKDKSGTNYDGQNWLQRASRGDFISAVRALKSRPAPDHFAAAMPDDTTLLQDCKEKLELYRRTYGNEYIGGVPLLQLVLRIDAAIQGAAK
jgi:hypothetical protein